MEKDTYMLRQQVCRHEKTPVYTQKEYDALYGFEYTFTRCENCHKILELKARKIGT